MWYLQFLAFTFIKKFVARCYPGYCVDVTGNDINDGISTFPGFGYQNGKLSKKECLDLCHERRKESRGKITACEYKNDHRDLNLIDTRFHVRASRCLAHTMLIAKGNGRETDHCCIYEDDAVDFPLQSMLCVS